MKHQEPVLTWIRDPRKRPQVLSVLSGGMIILGLAAGDLARLPALSNALMAGAALVAGSDIFIRAWKNLRNRAFSIELLVSIATLGALAIGEFWEAAAVTFLFIFGAYLEARTLSQTRKILGELLELAPVSAFVLRNGQQIEVLPNEVQPGETVIAKPGLKLPVDGVVIDGHSTVDESAITGEPIPEEKMEGDNVYAGTVNQKGVLKIRTTGVGADTTLARIIQRVEEAQEEKAPTQRFIERFARWYTPAVITLSVFTFLLWRDIELSLTLLVIGCPGALVISTPISIVAGIGRAAKQGILIKGGEYLENAGKITAVALDKTGTLTQGKPRLTDIIVLEDILAPVNLIPVSGEGETIGWDSGQWNMLRLAGIAEANSEHPLAQPILAEISPHESLPEAYEFESMTGKGVIASYRGDRIAVGTAALMDELNIAVPSSAEQELKRLKADGKTAVLVALNRATIGILGIADSLRPDAAKMVHRLHRAGVKKVVMLTGDDRLTADVIAKEAGIDYVYAELLPEAKLEAIRHLKKEGHVVAMIGDGINDAPALAAADIGIAMGAAGTDIAIETADMALMADDLLKIPQAIGLSKAVLRNIRQNVLVALVTVTILLAGVLLGQVNMAGGMLIHQASVLIVILNGMRLLRA